MPVLFGLVDFMPFASNLVERHHYVSEDLNLSIAGSLVHFKRMTKLKCHSYILRLTTCKIQNKNFLFQIFSFYYLN